MRHEEEEGSLVWLQQQLLLLLLHGMHFCGLRTGAELVTMG
jgi:hypothetical protein